MEQQFYEVFFSIGAVLILGFFTSQIFERTKFSDIILLMFVGMLLGPVFKVVEITGSISVLAPYIGILALIVILFDGGLNLDIFKVLTSLSKAAGFTVLSFGLTVGFLGVLMHLVFGWSYIEGLLLGAVVGGTSSAIVIPLISKLSMSQDSKVVLSLESALTDALCIIVALALIEVIQIGTVSFRDIGGSLASAFSIAAVIASIFAVFWIGALNTLYIKQVGYFMTLAIVFILYSVVELVKGNGAIAVLVFAILLGNFNGIAKRTRLTGEFKLDPTLRAFQVEVSFFVRTFFFIFTGMMFNLAGMDIRVGLTALSAFILLSLARMVGVKALLFADEKMRPFERSLIVMMPRGLAAVVLASMPVAAGIVIPNFTELVFAIVILTNLAATFGIFFIEHDTKGGGAEPPNAKAAKPLKNGQARGRKGGINDIIKI